MANYIPVLILMGIGALVAIAVLIINQLLGPKRPNRMKLSVYECGVPPLGDARKRVSVKFYLVAIIFLLFDVEAVFLFPWAVVYRKYLTINSFILLEMLFFVAILLVGYLYILKKGVLEWD